MGLLATAPIKDLLALYKSPDVNGISTFGDVANQLSPNGIAAAYNQVRLQAPHRHERNKSYFVDHAGAEYRSESSNRREEHLALALWGASQCGDALVLPGGDTLKFLDYQMPLKARQGDEGIGKVDLIGLINQRRPAVIELKVHPTTGGLGNTPLLAFLECLAYCAIFEANAAEIASDARTKFNAPMEEGRPALVVMAPEDYWIAYFEHPKTGSWWPTLSRLAEEISVLIDLQVHFLGLRDATFTMGNKDQSPQLTGQCSVVDVADLISN